MHDTDKSLTNLRVDFTTGALRHRRLHGGGTGQLIAKACGLKKIKNPTVLDLTAGLGRDAFVLACLGCDVTMVERSPIIAALLEDALHHLSLDEELSATIKLRLIKENAIDYLNRLPKEKYPDVILIDPMHPPRQKSALVKKEMRILRDIVGDDLDANELLTASIGKAKRIVVKRPRLAPTLGDRKPSLVYEGKSTRFDVYF